MTDSGEEYEHWPADNSHFSQPAYQISGYDTHNGLRQHTYTQSKKEDVDEKNDSPIEPKPKKPKQDSFKENSVAVDECTLMENSKSNEHASSQEEQPQALVAPLGLYQTILPACSFHQPGATITYPSGGYPAAYVTYNYIPAGTIPCSPAVQPAQHISYAFINQPPGSGVLPWLGRTKAQVEADNMEIAAREGANDRRSAQPVGINDDQMLWVAELDGSHTLRMFGSIKELKGEWMVDPRFGSWYFVRAAEDEEK
ncbi:Hypothetical protein R9X50_00679900 [Acrodontium crateriforme]|uniref:Uncharacterized protein n=1 Tax=Acrodontium crateriforme TaxID=150365 RepID=A0AAQ3RBT0_9PEZI|nr:Hypothetical protein R9X50_00679900 [Acrodontium crateriforme]